MSEAAYKMTGIVLMIVSIFLLAGGLYLPDDGGFALLQTPLLIAGVLMLAVGVVFYKVIRKDS
ncbi:MAG: hypothetical protein IJQ26_05045 [Lachnospiraceae bacterium]|nr:hypothetical protein [Lachnospiraceae bacterium]